MNSNAPERRTSNAVEPVGNGQFVARIDPEVFLRCVHCGLCTSTCPTFTELGDENDGPRGRIQLMRMVAEGRSELTARMRRHLELCLDCRACETACPSGVQYGRLIEPFRLAVQEADRRPEKRFDLVPRTDPLAAVSLRRPDAQAAGARAILCSGPGCSIWPSGWGCWA